MKLSTKLTHQSIKSAYTAESVQKKKERKRLKMRQKDSSGRFKLILIVLTVVALFVNNEIFGNIIALIWAFWGMFKLLKAAAEGGAFN